MMQQVELYTDGAARGNPGPAGFGVILKYGKYEKEVSLGFRRSTNNRMELLAVIVGLELLTKGNQKVTVYSDSKYVVDSVEKKWVFNWERKGFKNKKNPDLWKRFLTVYRNHHVNLIWIKGHNNHPLNERCDRLAVKAALEPTAIDHFFEQQENKPDLFTS